MSTGDNKVSGKVWTLLWCVWIAQAATYVVKFGYGLLMPGILKDMAAFDLTPGILGNIVGVGTFGTVILTIPLSVFAVKLNPRYSVPIIISCTAIGLFLFGMADSVPLMYASYIAAMAFFQAIGTMLVLVKVKGVPTSHMTRVNGIENFVGPTGQVLATLAMAGILAFLGSWRAVYMSVGVVMFVAAVIYYIFYGDDVTIEGAPAVKAAGPAGDEMGALEALKIAWSNKTVWLLSLAWPGTTVVWMAMFYYWPSYAMKAHGLTLAQTGFVLSLIPIFSAIASFVAPTLADRLGYDKPLIWPWGFILPVFYFMMTRSSSMPVLCLCSAVAGFGAYCFVPMGFTALYKIGLPMRAVSMAVGTLLSFISLGVAVAGTVIGALVDRFGLQMALAISCLSPIWFGMLTLFIPELGRKKMEELAAAREAA